MEKVEELRKKLAVLKSCTVTRGLSNLSIELFKLLVNKKDSSILEFSPGDFYLADQIKQEDLFHMQHWRTFNNRSCIRIRAIAHENQIQWSVSIYSGESFSGQAVRNRFKALLLMPLDSIKYAEQDINSSFDNYMEGLYHKKMDRDKAKWIDEVSRGILNSK